MKRLLKNIFEFSIALIVVFIFFELFLRFSEIGQVSPYELNPKLGSVFKPSQPIISIKEGIYIGQTNEFGYLGPSYEKSKPNNVIRIALVGDSYVEGFHLSDKYHLRNQLEESLKKLSGKKIEVLNFGRSGYNFNRMYIYYNEFVKKFNPDITFFFLSPGDLNETSTEIGPVSKLKGDSLITDYSFAKSQKFLFLKNSEFIRQLSFYNLIQSCWVIYRKGNTLPILFDKLYDVFSSSDSITGNKVKLKLKDEMIKTNKKIIYELSKAYNSHNKIVFVLRKDLTEDYKSFIDECNIYYINLFSYIDPLNINNELNYWLATNQNGHWNHYAHKLIGIYLANETYKLMYQDWQVNRNIFN